MPAQQLTLRESRDDFAAGRAAVTLLDLADPGVQRAQHVESFDQLSQRHDTTTSGQRHVALAEPNLLPAPLAPA